MSRGHRPIRTGVPDVGTSIYADTVKPGMIVELPDGSRIEVAETQAGYTTFTFTGYSGRTAQVAYGDRVKVLGHFNLDN